MIFSTLDASKIQLVLPVKTMKFDLLKRKGSPFSVIFSIKPKKDLSDYRQCIVSYLFSGKLQVGIWRFWGLDKENHYETYTSYNSLLHLHIARYGGLKRFCATERNGLSWSTYL